MSADGPAPTPEADEGAGAGAEASPPGRDGLLVVGDVVTDVVARHAKPLAAGTDTAAEIRLLPGGAGANAACWAARWGCLDVRLLGRVGAESAAWHERALRDAGVRPHLVVDEEAPAGTVVSLVDTRTDGAERTFLTDSGAVLRLSRADWSDELLDGVGRMHLSGYLFFARSSRDLALTALASARARGVPVSVDPASAGFLAELGAERFLQAVAGAEVLLPNGDEATALTGLTDPAAAAARLTRRLPSVVATLGADGALVCRAGVAPVHVPPVPTTALDSTGAGDAFTGAFLAARLAGADPGAAAAEGCRAGARAVGIVGGRPR